MCIRDSLTGILTRFMSKALILNIGLIIQAAFIMAFGFSKSFPLMLFVYFMIGFAGGLIETLVSLILPEINKTQTAYYINISQVFFGVGAFAGPYLSSLIAVSYTHLFGEKHLYFYGYMERAWFYN